MSSRTRDEILAHTLNQHGYAFQCAVSQQVELLRSSRGSPWGLAAIEFPVSLGGRDRRTDLVLQHRQNHSYLVVECKRANPRYGTWCFVRRPIPKEQKERDWLTLEELSVDTKGNVGLRAHRLQERSDVYHIGVVTKAAAKGDSSGTRGDDAIEAAATQALQGSNGLIEYLRSQPHALPATSRTRVMPVVITTANLAVSDVDLSVADLRSGLIPNEAVTTRDADWVFLQYHQSYSMRHSGPMSSRNTLQQVLEDDFVRSIAFVCADGIAAFLKDAIWGR